MSVDAIDFGQLYREHMARAGRREKSAEEWDTRAPAMSRGLFSGAYLEGFVARLDLRGCETLLDVGCGPGTIALTVAPRLAHVYGLDYSPGMLEEFDRNARARGVTNATTILRAWEDAWDDVPVCDVVVASRSTQVADLEAALLKLHAHARRRVYVTHKVGGRFLPAAVYEALGRTRAAAGLHLRDEHPAAARDPSAARLSRRGEPAAHLCGLRRLREEGGVVAGTAERRRA
jgi:SAM-dependent methyltransferase